MDKYQKNSGFTLIEVMIVVAMIAILASLALGAFSGSSQKARRADAKASLTELAAEQEKYYFREKQYTDNLANLNASTSSSEGYYTLSASTATGATGCANAGACFVLTATATSGKAQFDDSSCRSFTISNAGSKKAYDSAGTLDASGLCW
ncbi:type IV pilin protein [Agaribacterium haliotis]|uniref:type IV pilin protein n=1 Tax=Agaribacterium haliotis TaxID=2013869 RepID=UPI000BB59F45|nr:type IV pilin protein [Agaribacterium haliotis]